MVTLQKKTLNFNTQLTVSNDGGDISSNSGMILFEEFLHHLNFQPFLSSQLKLSDQRAYYTYPEQAQMTQMLRQLVLGYATDDAATRLRLDPFFGQPVTSVQ